MENENPKFNLKYELNRIQFICNRDGVEAAKAFAKQIIHQYLRTVRAYKKVPGGKRHPYRYGYVESAFSARYILNNFDLLIGDMK